MSSKKTLHEFLEKNFSYLYALLAGLIDNLELCRYGRLDDAITKAVAENPTKALQKMIAELDAAIDGSILSTDELADLINYDLQSDAEAQAFLIRLRDGLRDGLAARLKADENG
jgi:hypothetical protein